MAATGGVVEPLGAAQGGVAETRSELIPRQIGPVAFGQIGRWITVRCSAEFSPLMRHAGGTWDPGNHLWLIHVRRVGPVICELRRTTDPLFRRAGIDLDSSR
jgi:hypothetical protein